MNFKPRQPGDGGRFLPRAVAGSVYEFSQSGTTSVQFLKPDGSVPSSSAQDDVVRLCGLEAAALIFGYDPGVDVVQLTTTWLGQRMESLPLACDWTVEAEVYEDNSADLTLAWTGSFRATERPDQLLSVYCQVASHALAHLGVPSVVGLTRSW